MMTEQEIVDIVEANYHNAMQKAYLWSRAAIVAIFMVSLLTAMCVSISLIPSAHTGTAGTCP